MPARRFPPPWSVEDTDACFIVRDANGHALAYVYFEEEPGPTRGFSPSHSKSSKRLDDRKHPRAAERFCTVTIACHDRAHNNCSRPSNLRARNFMEIAVVSDSTSQSLSLCRPAS
jgi:hypothetical protein